MDLELFGSWVFILIGMTKIEKSILFTKIEYITARIPRILPKQNNIPIFCEENFSKKMCELKYNCKPRLLLPGRLVNGFNQSTLQRISSMKSLEDAKRAFLVLMPCSLIYSSAVCFIGLTVFAYFSQQSCDPYKARRPDCLIC